MGSIIKDRLTHVVLGLILFMLLIDLPTILNLSYYVNIRKCIVELKFTPLISYHVDSIILMALLLFLLVLTLRSKMKTLMMILVIVVTTTLFMFINSFLSLAFIVVSSLLFLFVYVIFERRILRGAITSLLNLLLVVYVMALTTYILMIMMGNNSILQNPIAQLEVKIWGALGCLNPLFITLTLYWWIVRPVVRSLQRAKNSEHNKQKDEQISHHVVLNYRIILMLGLVLSVLVMVLPYSPTINPLGIPVAVDAYYYETWLKEVTEKGVRQVLIVANGTRPLYMLILYALHKGFNISIREIAMYHNIPWMPLLTLSVYYLTLKMYKDKKIAAIAALLTPLTPTTLAFIYGGFQTHHLALVISYLAIALYTVENKRKMILAIILTVILTYIHPWAWISTVATITLVTLYKNIKERKIEIREIIHGKPYKYLTLYLLANFVAYIIKSTITPRTIVRTAEKLITLENILKTPLNMLDLSYTYMWTSYNNPVYYLSSAISILHNEINPIHILAFIVSLLIPFSHYAGAMSRYIMVLPLQVFIAKKFYNRPRVLRTLIAMQLTFTIRQVINVI